MKAHEAEAWKSARGFARALAKAQLPGYRATYLIGSLAGGYFEAGSSDIDLVVLFAGQAPQESESLASYLAEMAREWSAKHPPYEIECLPHYEDEFRRDASGRLPKTDLAARMLVQSQCLDPKIVPLTIDTPFAEDFRAELKPYLLDHGTKSAAGELSNPKQLVNHALTLMRFYLAIEKELWVYNKNEIIKAYQQGGSSAKVPEILQDCFTQVRNGTALDKASIVELRSAVGSFENKLLNQVKGIR
jgi:predicted nucleotidyltransferase